MKTTYSDMQPWRPQNGAMSASLYKASSKPERCSEAGSQCEQTLAASKRSKGKEHQDKCIATCNRGAPKREP